MRMWWSCVPLVLAASAVCAAQETTEEEGKLRLDAVAVYDVRVGHIGTPTNDRRPQFQLLTRLTGRVMDDVTRLSLPIISEFVDDTGTQLVDTGKFRGLEDQTHPYHKTKGAKGFEHIDLPFNVDVRPSRAATKLASVKGYVLVVFGGAAEPVFIPHAKRFMGGNIVHPRLDEFDIRIRMLLPEEVGLEERGDSFALAFESNQSRIRNVTVYDDWLHNALPQARHVPGDNPHTVFRLEDIQFTEDCELGVYIFPNSKTERVDFEFKDVPLP